MQAKPTGGEGSVVDEVADALREGIRSGRFVSGQRLPEAELTKELGVSRGPLREALSRLAAEGLVELQHHRGARIRAMSRKDVLDLQDVREALEGLAAAHAARRVAAGELKGQAILDLVGKMEAALKAGSISRYLELNSAFHELLVQWSNNKTLAEIVRHLQISAFRLQMRTSADLASLGKAHKDHVLIAKAVAAGDSAAAEAAMRRHINNSKLNVQRLADALFADEQDSLR